MGKQKFAVLVSRNSQTILQKPINRTKQNILHLQEELRLSEIIQTITVVK